MCVTMQGEVSSPAIILAKILGNTLLVGSGKALVILCVCGAIVFFCVGSEWLGTEASRR